MRERPTVVVVLPLPSEVGEQRLREETHVLELRSARREDILPALAVADAVVVYGPARFDAELIAAAPRLRVIGTPGSGVDPIDVAAATRRGIPVVHTRGASPRGVAEYVLSAMVLAHRDTLGLQRGLVTGEIDWQARVGILAGTELSGTTLGVVGYGAIGRTVAVMAGAAYGMEVLAHDPVLAGSGAPVPGPARLVSDLDELLERSSTVSLHCPLTEHTRCLLGRRELDLVGADGVLVNASRGGVVDGDALMAALREGTLKGAVVDVHDPEPPDAALRERWAATPHLVVTPHVAGITRVGNKRVSLAVADGVLAALRGERPPVVANPEVYRKT